MIEPKTIKLEGMQFHLQPLPALRAMRLDKKVISLLVPIFGGLKGFSLDKDIDTETMARGLSEALERMPDKDYEIFVVDLLSGTAYLTDGQAPRELDNTSINDIFRGQIMTLYKLMFEVMRYNKFSPFGLAEGGNVMSKIVSSFAQEKSGSRTGNKSERSANLLES